MDLRKKGYGTSGSVLVLTLPHFSPSNVSFSSSSLYPSFHLLSSSHYGEILILYENAEIFEFPSTALTFMILVDQKGLSHFGLKAYATM